MNSNLKSFNINWEALGAELALLSDGEQGLFFKGFADEMNKYSTRYNRDMQLTYLRSKLKKEQVEVYTFLGWQE